MKVVIKTSRAGGCEYRIGDVPRCDMDDIANNMKSLGPKFFGKSEAFTSRIDAFKIWGHFNDVIDCGHVQYPV